VGDWILASKILVQKYGLFSEPDIVKTIKFGSLRWAGRVAQILDDNPIKNSPS
jgi:hypothetical protein